MNYVPRIRRDITLKETDQSEEDAIRKLTYAFAGIVKDLELSGGSQDEISAVTKMSRAFAKVVTNS